MRLILFLFLVLLWVGSHAQKCEPNTPVRAIMCPNWWDSASVCFKCGDCIKGLIASDTSFAVSGYKVTLQTSVDGELVTKEADINGNFFTGYVRMLIAESKNGDVLSFSCVRAKKTDGKIFILQPIKLDIKLDGF